MLAVLVVLLAVSGAAYAETTTPAIALTPTGYITVPLGGTKQFSAKVTNLTDTTVAWSVGRPGLNTGLGTISPTGLYTAPATLPSNTQIQITATSVSNPTVSAITFLYLLGPGPTISGISPNPLPSGTVTITVAGTGFQPGATVMLGNAQMSTKSVSATSVVAIGYQAPATSATLFVTNPGTSPSNTLTVPVTSSGGSNSGGSSGGSVPVVPGPAVVPASATLALGSTQAFTAQNVTTWSAAFGSVTAAGLYTAPAVMPANGKDTVTATGPGGSGSATVTLVSNIPPVIQSITSTPLPLGMFSTVITGTGFTNLTTATLGTRALTITAFTPTSLTVVGFAGSGGMQNVLVANGPVSSLPFPVQVGVANPVVSPAAARRFLEQAAFGPTPADAAHVQAIGFQAWLAEQFSMPQISNYTGIANSQGGMPAWFLANAVTNNDQLRQRVGFALHEIFVTSLVKLIWNSSMVPYQNMLLADAFSNYRQILGDVTLSPAMGNYLDMANNAKANPAAGTVANENYAREVMQLFSIGTVLLKPDGTPQIDPITGTTIPTYLQHDVTELARVFTGWGYAGKPWNGFINPNAPMVPFAGMHDAGSKTLLNGYVAAAGLSPLADLNGALDMLANHPNTAPFISKQLIQHLVKSNPTPAYVGRVASAWLQSNGDMPTVITAILLDAEARANDEGGADLSTDGHLQEPALLLPGYIRAFGGTMTTGNWYSSNLASMGQDLFSPPSVFNYFSPGYTVQNSGGLKGPEFQIDNPNNAILRENLIATFFNQYSNPIQSYGPGTTVDLSPFLPLAPTPSTLLDALDLTLTHGTMPAGMRQIVLNAINADGLGSLHRVQTGIYLILTSSYYNVWH
ncbi:MAG TPA: DUF1800 family protein [Vicinamibacterales bacterium]|nr:DUF1800 family protein [Vicinamibacterales bacterium]